MSYRQLATTSTWHWCFNCSAWPLNDFTEREDLPPSGAEQSVCRECVDLDRCSDCHASPRTRVLRATARSGGGVPIDPVRADG